MKERSGSFRKIISTGAALFLVCGMMPQKAVYADDSPNIIIYIDTITAEGKQAEQVINITEPDDDFTLREAGVTLPDYTSDIPGVNFVGWVDVNGNPVTEDTVLHDLSNDYVPRYTTIRANYDKAVLGVDYTYVNQENRIETENKVYVFEPGTALKDALAEPKAYIPANMTSGNGITFDHWDHITVFSEDGILNTYSSRTQDYYADYKEGKTVYLGKNYIDPAGFDASSGTSPDYGDEYIVVPDGTTYGQLYETLRNKPLPAMYEGLRFKNWDFYAFRPDFSLPAGDNDPLVECIYVDMDAQYENALVRFAADPEYAEVRGGYLYDPAYYKCVLAEIGETVEIPNSLPGADQIVWFGSEKNGTYVVEKEGAETFWGVPVERVFTDVEKSSPYNDAIYWALFNKITKGRTDTLFSPDSGCTRGQFVTFLWRMAGEPEPAGTVSFNDMVPESSPYYKAILWAAENGITQGYSGNVFKSAEVCSRGAALTFLYRAAGSPEVSGSADFTDMVPADHAYYNAILWGVENNITLGYKDGTFKPFRTCSRGQNVTFLYRAEYFINF